jgi:rhodanese-related sulfurtransferase
VFFGPRVQHMSTDDLRQALKTGSPIVIDVREPYEFAAGHVPGAVNLPIGTLPAAAATLDHEADTMVICQSGHRSVTAAKRLMKAGFTNVRSVQGGTSAWQGKLER